MPAFRPIWNIEERPKDLPAKAFDDLIDLERVVIRGLNAFSEFVDAYVDEGEATQARALISTANTDLVAGCELARFGYLKQAYSLWRSWYEQVIFALYFLEAPIHRQAWKVSKSVTIADSPKYRLMLHQLLADSSEKHAFMLVYADRYQKLLEGLKRGKPVKDRQPLIKAGKILTVLSQGVHGTYRPAIAQNEEELSSQLLTHCIPTLNDAWLTVSEFWLLFLTSLVDFPEDVLIKLAQGNLTKADAELLFPSASDPDFGITPIANEVDLVINLNDFFLPAFN